MRRVQAAGENGVFNYRERDCKALAEAAAKGEIR